MYQDDEDLAVQEEEAEKRDGLQTKVSGFIYHRKSTAIHTVLLMND